MFATRWRFVLIACIAMAARLPAQSIFTVAGGGTDDGRPATTAAFLPVGVALDSVGNLYIADYGGHRVRKVSAATGTISTVAGIGSQGFSGDGGPAASAAVSYPTDITFDASGNLYITDSGNDRIRKVDAATGIISTIAGGGTGSGENVPATSVRLSFPYAARIDDAGNVYIAEFNRIRKVEATTGIITTIAGSGTSGFSGDGGPATAAQLFSVEGLALDRSGNVFISDHGNQRIRKVDIATRIISTVAGNGTGAFSGDGGAATAASLYYPVGIALDAAGNLYIADSINNRIRQVAAGTGSISTVAGNGSIAFSGDGGPATAAGLRYPNGVALDAAGNLYIADTTHARVRKVGAATGIISTVAGNGAFSFLGDNGPALSAGLDGPSAVAVDDRGNLYIADSDHERIRKVDAATGTITTIAGTGTFDYSGDGGPATAATLHDPEDLAFDSSGNLLIADTFNSRIRKISAASGIISTVAGNGMGAFSGDGGPATAASIYYPGGVAVDAAGSIYIGDTNNHRVRKVAAATGIITTIAGNGTKGYSGDGGPATAASLYYPVGVTLDAAGNIYVADSFNYRIRKIDAASGIISTFAGNGSILDSGDGGPATAAGLGDGYRLAFDAAGNLYIATHYSGRVRKVAAGSGIISTVAGIGRDVGYRGDGGPAASAGISVPNGVAVDASGNLFIAEWGSGRIRAVFACVTVARPDLSTASDSVQGVTSASLEWSAAKGAFRYDIYIDKQNPPQKIVALDISVTSYVASNLDPGTRYYWKVTAKGDPFCSPVSTTSSEVRAFNTAVGCSAPGGFDLSQPANGASGVSSSTQLSWQTATGAANYDLYFGTSNPPPLLASGLTTTSRGVTGLTANTTYYWSVVAHASCDLTKTTASPTRSFQTAGACAAAGAFSLNSPSNGAAGVSTTTTLDWSSSSNASSYDVYLGTSSPPPLYLLDVPTPRIGVSGLEASRTYFWRVIAKVPCDPLKNLSSPTSAFTTAGACLTPGAASIVFVPPGNIGVGQTYTVAWQELPELGTDGYYLIERSTISSFATILDSQQSFSTSASFISSTAGTYYHRVRAVPGCDPSHRGPVSPVKGVNVVTGTANVIFTVQPQAVITALGDKLEDQRARFTLENLGNSSLQVILGKAEINSVPFFTWRDPLGGDSVFVTLDPRIPKSFDLQFSGPPNDRSGAYQGIVFVAATGQGLAITPYAFVNLKVGGGATSRPVFLTNGTPTEYTFFPGFTGDDTNRPPITVGIRNDGTALMELGAEIGPEVWLVPEPGWNATPIPVGASRSIRLTTQRSRAPNGSALPRYTYFTVRSKNGETARLLVQDNDALPKSFGRTSLLDPGSRSIIVPDVVSAPPQFSRVRLTNVGSDPVQADLFFTPARSDGLNAAAVKRATIVVPPNDVVTLTDPLMQVFGLTAPAQGQIEVRAAPEKIGFLIVSSSVLTPVTSGGNYSYEMPTLLLGEGARLGNAHVIVGVGANANTRAALTLVETSGKELTRVRAILFDAQGARKGDRLVDVARYGQTPIDNVVTALGGNEPLDGGRIELDVESGGGSVAGVVTMLDATRNNGASLVSQPAAGTVTGSAYARLRQAQIAANGATLVGQPAGGSGVAPLSYARVMRASATSSATAVAPVAVNGAAFSVPNTTFRTSVGLTTTGNTKVTAVVTYRDSAAGSSPLSRTVELFPGLTLHFDNVLEELFGVTAGAKAQGSIFVDAAAGAQIYARLGSRSGNSSGWSVAANLPVIPTVSDVLTSLTSRRPLYLDGLEQSVDPSRGATWIVMLNEISGSAGTVTVRLYEAGNRSLPIAEKTLAISAFGQLRLNVFPELALDSDERRKDRTNVLCVVSAASGGAVVSASAIAIDNRTGDTRGYVFSPNGGVPATGVTRVSVVTPVAPEKPRRRIVKH